MDNIIKTWDAWAEANNVVKSQRLNEINKILGTTYNTLRLSKFRRGVDPLPSKLYGVLIMDCLGFLLARHKTLKKITQGLMCPKIKGH